MSSENNKRIAKNTMLLYFRMLITMFVTFFTVRVVLSTLGATDYGLYNVVGGVVTMLSFLSNTMAGAFQRFFSYEIGRNNLKRLKQVFSMSLTVNIGLSVVVLIIAETVGLWFLNNKLNIPVDRLGAANVVFQCTVVIFIATIISAPYNAALIAHENMKVFAYISILEVLLKLVVVFLLSFFAFDKLIFYSILILIAHLFITSIYILYCWKKYHEARYRFMWEKDLFKELTSFSGWNLFGAIADVANNQGINILLNVFFGPVVNTARGIGFQINNAVKQFTLNFLNASRPQIIKYHAAGDKEDMFELAFKTSKFSFFLILFVSMPILVQTDYLLSFWLDEFPLYTVEFVRLLLVVSLVEAISYPLMIVVQASGEIKKYQIIIGLILLLNLPFSYFLLSSNYSPLSVLYVALIISVTCLGTRVYLMKTIVNLQIKEFLVITIMPIFKVLICSVLVWLFIKMILVESLIMLMVVITITIILTFGLIVILGLTKPERLFLYKTIKTKISR